MVCKNSFSLKKKTAIRHVLQIVPDLDIGGVESLLEEFVRTPPAGWQAEVVATRKGGQTAERIRSWGGRVTILHQNSRGISPKLILQLRALICQKAPHVVHCRCVEANLHGVLAARLAGRVPCLAEEVGLSADIRSWLAQAVVRMIYRRASGIIGQSRAVCDDLRKAGVHHPVTRVIHNPVGPDFLLPPRPFPPGPRRLLSVGRLVPEKNFQLLLRAFAIVHPSHPRCSLVIVGDGPLREELKSEAAQLGLGQAVRFLGQQPHDPQIFSSGEIFVMSSSREGHPMAMLEAMAAGLPVLATRVGGIPEIMQAEDGCGHLVPPNDIAAMAAAMKNLLMASPQKLDAMGRRASAKVRQEFSHEAYLQKIGRFYGEICS